MPGSQDFTADPRNAHALVWLNGKLVSRGNAKVSVFDAGFVLGDGVWEGIRLHKGGFAFLDAHLDRLFAGASAIALDIGKTREEIVAALHSVCEGNGMKTGVHIRLMVTRGPKTAPNQDPRNALGAPTIVITAEHKEPSEEIVTRGLKLATSSIRCTPAEMFDMRLNSHSRLNLIRALLEAIDKGADEALMLDPRDFVSSCNATNFFWVKDGEVRSSTGEFCFNGVTRANVVTLCRDNDIPIRLENFALARRSRRRRSLRHRHLWRIDARARNRRPRASHGTSRPDDRAPARALCGAERQGRGGGMTIRIAMWSGPRNISTAMMRSFENREDTAVVDEPFYAAYLAATGLDHPMREAVLASQPRDWRDVAKQLLGPAPGGRAVFYQKHMTHHMLPEFGREWIGECRNAFLIRAPEEVLASYEEKRAEVVLADIGFVQQAELFDREAQRLGHAPPVIESSDVLKHPGGMMGALCAALGIPFSGKMLAWPPGGGTAMGCGRRPGTTRWSARPVSPAPRETAKSPFPDHLKPIAEAARPYYDRLVAHRISPV